MVLHHKPLWEGLAFWSKNAKTNLMILLEWGDKMQGSWVLFKIWRALKFYKLETQDLLVEDLNGITNSFNDSNHESFTEPLFCFWFFILSHC